MTHEQDPEWSRELRREFERGRREAAAEIEALRREVAALKRGLDAEGEAGWKARDRLAGCTCGAGQNLGTSKPAAEDLSASEVRDDARDERKRLESAGKGAKKKPATRAKGGADAEFSFYEFFAGGGMVRAGLGPRWHCLFANDFDFKKSAAYKENWGDDALVTKDIGTVQESEIPGAAGLAWASFPCQDLSLAGMGAGLKGDRSGTFWPFWRLMKALRAAGRGPRMIVLENVCGTLTSHGGKDFTAIADALSEEGYRFGAVVIDAVEFVPQSRPRLFIIAVAEGVAIPEWLTAGDASMLWHPKALQVAQLRLTGRSKEQWVWWRLPAPPRRNTRFADLIEENPTSVQWHTPEETAKLLGMMSELNREKVRAAQRTGQMLVGGVYKRTRLDGEDAKVQRAEVRFDDVAGCLRTSSGGSSRQSIIVVKGDTVRSRLLSSREAARLMGLPDDYKLPKSYNEAYHLIGDGVAVPVVRYIAEHLLEPILVANNSRPALALSREAPWPSKDGPSRKGTQGQPLGRDTL